MLGSRMLSGLAIYLHNDPNFSGNTTLSVLKNIALDRDNGIFNSSNTDVVEKVNFLVAVSQHGGTSVAEGSP